MNRRNSFLISFFIHLLLLVLVFVVYKSITPSKKEQIRVPIKLSQCMVSNSTCKAKESLKEEPKKVEKEFKSQPIQKSIKEQPKLPQEQKSSPVQNSSVPPMIEEKTLKDVPKEQVAVTQKTLQKPPQSEIKNTTPKEQAPKSTGQEYMKTNISAIIAMLHENFYYPSNARKRGIQGEVVVKFTLCKNREIKDIKVSKDAPEILSKAAINTIESLNQKLPAPAEELVLELPIDYKLH